MYFFFDVASYRLVLELERNAFSLHKFQMTKVLAGKVEI